MLTKAWYFDISCSGHFTGDNIVTFVSNRRSIMKSVRRGSELVHYDEIEAHTPPVTSRISAFAADVASKARVAAKAGITTMSNYGLLAADSVRSAADGMGLNENIHAVEETAHKIVNVTKTTAAHAAAKAKHLAQKGFEDEEGSAVSDF